jgi:hypothetical protein
MHLSCGTTFIFAIVNSSAYACAGQAKIGQFSLYKLRKTGLESKSQ